jgi:hypothetical protein
MGLVLKRETAQRKFGVLYFRDAKGGLTALGFLTAAELGEHLQSGAAPAGLTDKEWFSGQYVVLGYDVDVGDVVLQDDGSVLVKYDHKIEGGEFIQACVALKADEFTGEGASITALPGVLDATPVASIDSGLLVLKPVAAVL